MKNMARNDTTLPVKVETYGDLLEVKAELTQDQKRTMSWDDVLSKMLEIYKEYKALMKKQK